MKKLIFLFIGMLMAVDVFSQDYTPTVNWPYLYPDFMEGELVRARNKRNKAQFNIHLDLGGFVVMETKGNFTSVVRNDGAYGTTSLNSTTTKTFLHNQNVVNAYNGYLMTDVYADLLAMKDDSESLRVIESMYLVIGHQQIPADKKSVAALEGMDKKAFNAFLKAEKIRWSNPQDLVKVIEYINDSNQ